MPKPYAVTIEIPKLTEKDWEKLIAELNAQAVFAAKLLAGEIPQDIETAFTKAGCRCSQSYGRKSRRTVLARTTRTHVSTSRRCTTCSARNLTATRSCCSVFGARNARWSAGCFRRPARNRKSRSQHRNRRTRPNRCRRTPRRSWTGAPHPADVRGDVRVPPVSAVGPKRLGGFPFWRGMDRFLDAIAPTYSVAAQRGLALFEADDAPSLDTAPEKN